MGELLLQFCAADRIAVRWPLGIGATIATESASAIIALIVRVGCGSKGPVRLSHCRGRVASGHAIRAREPNAVCIPLGGWRGNVLQWVWMGSNIELPRAWHAAECDKHAAAVRPT